MILKLIFFFVNSLIQRTYYLEEKARSSKNPHLEVVQKKTIKR